MKRMSTEVLKMKQIFYFLCGNFEKKHFIYGIKNAEKQWHYFEDQDTISSVHGSLPAILDSLIGTLDKVHTIQVPLVEQQWRNYYDNGKFIFKNRELKTYMHSINTESGNEASNSLHKNTNQLVFISGQSNPLLFLNIFEKCRDVKTDKDKMFKIRNFVDACHRAEFSELYFTSDWPSVRRAFIKSYASSYTENRKKELNIDFNEETTLRSFVERKLKGLSTYTTLPFFNQMEMTLIDLPSSVSKLFLVDEVMTKSKAEILDFCDSIQDLVQTMWENEKKETDPPVIQDPLNEMEIFIFDSELEAQSASMSSINPSGSVTVSKVGRKRGRPSKNLNTLMKISESSDSDISSQSSLASSNKMSVDLPDLHRSTKKVGVTPGKIVKRGRGRPRKNLITIPEESTDSVAEYLNEISDASSSTSHRSEAY